MPPGASFVPFQLVKVLFTLSVFVFWGFPGGTMVKNLPASAGDPRDSVEKIPWSRKRQPAPVFFLGKFPRQRSLAGCSPCGHKESDMTE